jgi:hypothetical protein
VEISLQLHRSFCISTTSGLFFLGLQTSK